MKMLIFPVILSMALTACSSSDNSSDPLLPDESQLNPVPVVIEPVVPVDKVLDPEPDLIVVDPIDPDPIAIVPTPNVDDPIAIVPDPIVTPSNTSPTVISADDFYGVDLEIDTEPAIDGGPPTQPKNLRIDLLSYDWVELNWAPSNGTVVEYKVYRNDGVEYSILPNGIREEQKYWDTTTFIDCNYTRFSRCDNTGPESGDTFTYSVTAIGPDGQESVMSDPVTVDFLVLGAPVLPYSDPYLDESGFAQNNDLSQTAGFRFGLFTPVFSDNFSGTEIDASKWNTELVWGDNTIINGEQQYFANTQDNDVGYDPFVFNGETLTITAIQTPVELQPNLPSSCDDPNRCRYISGALSTHDTFQMTYGYVESRMRVSDTFGALSSFYLFHRYPGEGRNHHSPEIDIVEYLGNNPFGDEDAFQTYHYSDPITGTIMSPPTMFHKNPTGNLYSDEFHTYGVLWEPQLVIWYIDGQEVRRISGRQISRQGMNIVAYLVTGSEWAPPPTADQISLEIDYIKAYQRAPFNQ